MQTRQTPNMPEPEPVRLTFVCLGNICRSPTAEGIMTALVADAGLDNHIKIDSSGTAAWHLGKDPDERALAEAARRGLRLTSRSSTFHPGDAAFYDMILAMDSANVTDLLDRTPEPDLRGRIRRLREFDPSLSSPERLRADPWEGDVPDPWFGGDDGFVVVYDLIEAACIGLLEHVRNEFRARLP
ncbi:Wzb Protein-tyrosine-phosphatase [Acidimicrobiia bacterium]